MSKSRVSLVVLDNYTINIQGNNHMDDYIFNIGIYAYLGIRYLPMLKIQILLGLFTSRLYGNYHLLIPDMSKNPYRNHPTSIDRPLANGGGGLSIGKLKI